MDTVKPSRKKKKSRLGKRLIRFALLGLLVAAGAWFFTPPAPEVVTEDVRLGSLAHTLEIPGEVRARARYRVWAPVAGSLIRLALREGEPVAREQILARIAPDAALAPSTLEALEARLSAAGSAHATLSAERQQAERNLEAVRAELRQTEADPAAGAQTREQARLAVRLAMRELESLGFALQAAALDRQAAEEALARLRHMTGQGEWVVKSPVAGTVLATTKETRLAVGALLAEIGDARQLEAVAETRAAAATAVRPGQRARLVLEDGTSIEARVARILAPPEADTLLRIELDFDATTRRLALREGQRLKVQILTGVTDRVLKIPVTAVIQTAGRPAVWVVQEGRAQLRPVTLGEDNGEEQVVRAGLSEDERVILSPDPAIRDGTKVRLRAGS